MLIRARRKGSQCPSSASRAVCLAGWAVRGLGCPAPKRFTQGATSCPWRYPVPSCEYCTTTPGAAPKARTYIGVRAGIGVLAGILRYSYPPPRRLAGAYAAALTRTRGTLAQSCSSTRPYVCSTPSARPTACTEWGQTDDSEESRSTTRVTWWRATTSPTEVPAVATSWRPRRSSTVPRSDGWLARTWAGERVIKEAPGSSSGSGWRAPIIETTS